MPDHAVVIAGGGPAGMMLAGELMLAGAEVVVVERRASRELDGSRAGGLYARTIEVLDQRGIADRFLAEGQAMQVQGFAYIPLDISDFPTRHNYGLALWQSHFERILAGWIDELGVPIRMGLAVTGLTQDDAGVDVELDDGSLLRADYLVGCDGGRSTVRKAAGIDFAGFDPSISFMIAEAELADEPPVGIRREGGGIGPVNPQQGGNPYRIVLKEQSVDHTAEPTLDDLREALVAADGTDYGVRNPTWISRFTDASRQATSYRAGRVLLAGDAAHIHSPHGGQGLNTGVQDAVNLGWKLAQVANGTSPEELLDTYHAERHPVAARVLQNTMAQVALTTPDDRHDALRATLAEMLAMDEPRTAHRGDAHRPRHPLRPRGRTSAPRAAHPGRRPADRRWRNPRVRPPARRPSRPPQPRRTRAPRHLRMDQPSPVGRRHLQRHLGAARHRPGHRTPGRTDPTRRARRLGRRDQRPHPHRGADEMARATRLYPSGTASRDGSDAVGSRLRAAWGRHDDGAGWPRRRGGGPARCGLWWPQLS